MKTVSIVTPSLNQARWIEQAIGSVLAQGPDLAEYRVYDGGSTDESVEIIQRYSPRLTSWTSRPDLGQADAINQGLNRCTGDILGWVNSDDQLLPGALRYVRQRFEADPRLEFVGGMALLIDSNGRAIGAKRKGMRSKRMAQTGIMSTIQPACFFTRALWERVGPMNPDLHFTLDTDLFIRMFAQAKRVHRVDRYLACCRIHPEAKSQQTGHPEFNRELQQLRETYPELYNLSWHMQFRRFLYRMFDLKQLRLAKQHAEQIQGKPVAQAYQELKSMKLD